MPAAIARRPDLQIRRVQREIALAQVQLSQADLNLRTHVFASGATAKMLQGGISTLPPGYTLGTRMSWLLVDWGAAKAGIRQAELEASTADEQYADGLLQTELEVEQAHAAMSASRENILTASAVLEIAKVGLASARTRFKAGIGTQTDVLLALNDLNQAEGNRVRAITSYNTALAGLQRKVLAEGLLEQPGAGAR